jgi:predicted PurR-regulated permease PerM
VLVLAAAIGTTIILYYAKDLFILAFIAGIFAFLLHPLVR